jgi:transposase
MHTAALFDASELLRLHGRLLDGCVGVGETLANALLHTCPRNVRRRLPHLDPAIVQDSIDWAVQSYLGAPRSFDPTKGRLQSFIEQAAFRNAIDQLRSERARHAREALWAVERTRSGHPPETAEVPQTPRDVWPLLTGSRRDLSDHQWEMVQSLFASRPAGSRGRPPRPIRPVLNALISMLRLGGWQNLPSRQRSLESTRRCFRRWCKSGMLKEALDRLEADLRRADDFIHDGPIFGTESRSAPNK